MELAKTELTQKVLDRLCKESVINGIRFGPVLQILLDHINPEGEEPIFGQVYLNLGSRWKVFESRPPTFQIDATEIDEVPQRVEIERICELRDKKIVQVELGRDAPHLVWTLDDGRVVFINGKDERYEPWDLGVAFSGATWGAIACPGGGVALIVPDSYPNK